MHANTHRSVNSHPDNDAQREKARAWEAHGGQLEAEQIVNVDLGERGLGRQCVLFFFFALRISSGGGKGWVVVVGWL